MDAGGGRALPVLLGGSGFCHNEEIVTEAGAGEGILHESQAGRLVAGWCSRGGNEI